MHNRKETIVSRLLIGLAEIAEITSDQLGTLLFSCGSARILNQNLNKIQYKKYYSAWQGLERNGYIERVNENQFLVTAKGIRQIEKLSQNKTVFDPKKWKKTWIILVFDIPEDLKQKRNLFRCAIKRHGFIGLQNSVFVAPMADLKEISQLREDLGIAKYVSIFESKACVTDDDSRLKKYFGLD